MRTLSWLRNNRNIGLQNAARIIVPVQDRRSGPPLKLGLEIDTNGSLESAGRRIAFLGRLVEEYGIRRLPDKAKKASMKEIVIAK